MVVQTRINAKDNTIREVQPSTLERQVKQAEQTPAIPHSNELSPFQFNTPDSQINENNSSNCSDSFCRSKTKKSIASSISQCNTPKKLKRLNLT